MQKKNLVQNYINHLFTARNEHSIHSPFVFDFYLKVIKGINEANTFKTIDNIKGSFLDNDNVLQVTDFGAGSKINKTLDRKVSRIAKYSISSNKKLSLLYRIAQHSNAKSILELGTSLGIGTRYLALPGCVTEVKSLEGCPQIYNFTKDCLKEENQSKIELINGLIEDKLPSIIIENEPFDMIFFDGNHTFLATLEYFNVCKEKVSENTVFVFDDIFWSEGMQLAWEKICEDSKVKISIELFDFGIVFFRLNQPKQHFKLRW